MSPTAPTLILVTERTLPAAGPPDPGLSSSDEEIAGLLVALGEALLSPLAPPDQLRSVLLGSIGSIQAA